MSDTQRTSDQCYESDDAIPQFRNKPVVIRALQVPPNPSECDQLMDWLVALCEEWVCLENAIVIKTLEGDMRAEVGDWIIKGVKGEFYPCKPDIFEATYERA